MAHPHPHSTTLGAALSTLDRTCQDWSPGGDRPFYIPSPPHGSAASHHPRSPGCVASGAVRCVAPQGRRLRSPPSCLGSSSSGGTATRPTIDGDLGLGQHIRVVRAAGDDNAMRARHGRAAGTGDAPRCLRTTRSVPLQRRRDIIFSHHPHQNREGDDSVLGGWVLMLCRLPSRPSRSRYGPSTVTSPGLVRAHDVARGRPERSSSPCP